MKRYGASVALNQSFSKLGLSNFNFCKTKTKLWCYQYIIYLDKYKNNFVYIIFVYVKESTRDFLKILLGQVDMQQLFLFSTTWFLTV